MTATTPKTATSIQNVLLTALAFTFGYAIFIAIEKSLNKNEPQSSACGGCGK